VLGAATAAVLGAVAGLIDAVCFDQLFGVFPANQSGNAIFFGVALGNASWSSAWRPGLSMLGFVAGVALSWRLGVRVPVRHRARVLLAIELVLLAALTIAVGDVTDVREVLGGARAAVLLAVASAAMGVQTEVMRTHAGVPISTTYQTGALTNLGEHVVRETAAAPEDRPASSRAIVVLAWVLAGYIGGAAVGARLARDWGGVLVVPLVVLVGLIVVAPRVVAAGAEPST
jgi:uncharacterized membrane protein YoaK (UPF0700 family)